MSDDNLSDIVENLKTETEGDTVQLGDIIDALENRSIGPLLLIPALIAMVPGLGALPGVSALNGTLIILIAVQFFLPTSGIWVPNKLRELSVSRDKLTKGVDAALPWLKRVEVVLTTRFAFMARKPGIYFVAASAIAMGLLMYPAEIVPGTVMLPAGAVALLAAGVVASDGIVIGIGHAVALVALWTLWYLVPGI